LVTMSKSLYSRVNKVYFYIICSLILWHPQHVYTVFVQICLNGLIWFDFPSNKKAQGPQI